MIRMVVDLPAPLGPRKPVTRPGWAVKVTSSTAVKPPYVLVSDSTVIMARILTSTGCRGTSGKPPKPTPSRPRGPRGHPEDPESSRAMTRGRQMRYRVTVLPLGAIVPGSGSVRRT